jgi:hypothetical protein
MGNIETGKTCALDDWPTVENDVDQRLAGEGHAY